MRPFRSTSLLLAAFALVIGAAACSAATDASGEAFPGSGGVGDATPEPEDSGGGSLAAANDAGPNGAIQNNPLCHVPAGSACLPDDTAPPASNKCGVDLDGGGGGGTPLDAGLDAGPSPIACHVTLDPTSTITAPACAPSGTGMNGAQCLGSDDCAAGFECVGSPGVCRRYCCGIPTTTCDTNFFCDIQTETSAGSVKIPVCEPVQPCQLMGGDVMCGQDETCGIVNDDDGTTSCLGVGPADVSESCDDTHCKKDLVCLGDIGSKKCFALCDKTHPSCSSSETCKGAAPLFQGVNYNVGVCQ